MMTVHDGRSERLRVETVEVVLNVSHLNRGDLRVVLTSPSGTESVLADVHADPGDHYNNWVFTSKRNWDELSQGTWTLKVTDQAGNAVGGTFNSWALNIYGTTPDHSVHYVVVNSSDKPNATGKVFGTRAS